MKKVLSIPLIRDKAAGLCKRGTIVAFCDGNIAVRSITGQLGAKANTARKTVSLVLSIGPVGSLKGTDTWNRPALPEPYLP